MKDKELHEIPDNEFILESLLDHLDISLYVSDIDTYEIIYMSKAMKSAYHVTDAEGQLCWKILQEGMSGPCPFCPVPELLSENKKRPSCVWEECSSKNGHIYENHDSLVRWVDKRLVHLQYTNDITEFKRISEMARKDELTGMMNRRAGILALKDMMNQLKDSNTKLSVCLIDMDGLKQINDSFGHPEGDRSISDIAQAIIENLGPDDIAFRLGGDEFVVVFYNMDEKRTQYRMRMIKEELELLTVSRLSTHKNSFCHGSIEISGKEQLSVSEVISLADSKMYEQKREYHIQYTREVMNTSDNQKMIHEFDYDKENLYAALMECTDDYIFVGNMKTGTFRYSVSMVEEFGLPGQIIPNAAAIWGDKVHEEDKEVFLYSNQEIADGRVEGHNITYRAKNKDGRWVLLRCRGHLVRDKYGIPELFAGFIYKLGYEYN